MGSTDIGNCLPNPRGNGGYPILLHHHWLLLQGNLEMERLPVALGPHLSSSSLRNAPPGWHVQSTVLGSLAGTLSQGLPISPGFFPTSRCPMAKEVGPNGGFSQPLLRHLLGTWHTALSFHSVSNHSAVRKPPVSPLTEDRPRLGKMKHLPTPVNSKVAQRDWDPQFSDSEAATLSTTAPPRPWGLKTDGSLERSLLCSLFRETRAPPHVFPSPIHAESATARKFAQVHCGRSGCMSGSVAHASQERGRPRQRSLRHRGGATAPPPARQARWESLPLEGRRRLPSRVGFPSPRTSVPYTWRDSGGSWGREARVWPRRGGDALGGRCAPLLLPASCPQVPSGGGRSGGVWVAESRSARGRDAERRPEPPDTRVRCRPARVLRERDLEQRRTRPQLCEPTLERREGRWAGGQAGGHGAR